MRGSSAALVPDDAEPPAKGAAIVEVGVEGAEGDVGVVAGLCPFPQRDLW